MKLIHLFYLPIVLSLFFNIQSSELNWQTLTALPLTFGAMVLPMWYGYQAYYQTEDFL
jgi:hypothetical protein